MAKTNNLSLTRFDRLVLILGLAVASLISLGNMSQWSVWFDEAFSAMIIHHNFFDIARYTAYDVHPPLYYWTLKLWTMLWGDGPIGLRSLSLVWLLLAICVLYVFVRNYFGRLAAALSVLLLATSPMLVRYSEEARMYTMTVFIIVLATYVLLEAMKKPTKRKWVVYGVLVGVGMLTHYMTIAVWATHWLWRAYEVRRTSLRASVSAFFSPDWRRSLYATLIVMSWWLPFLVWQLVNIQGGGFWIGPVSMDTLPNYISNLYSYYDHNQVYNWLMVTIVVTVAMLVYLSTRAYRQLNAERKQAYRLVAGIALLPPIILLIGSLPPLRPSFVDRYVLVAVAFWSVWSAITYAVCLKKRSIRQWPVVAALVLVLCLHVIGISYVYAIGNYNKDNDSAHTVKPLMELIAHESKGSQPIVAETSWIFFEVAYLETDQHPAFFRSEDSTQVGAYEMLRDDSKRKIIDMDAFGTRYGKTWFVVRSDSVAGLVAKLPNWRVERVLKLTSMKSQLRAVELRYAGVASAE
ncbi:MAG TPA: glycosyltransferase family 39 protein [Candidatus Saccharimonas sp.]|jgi:mannosyltransferase|nr:glycosyltransferase family 39 protein [Candidatus Saccharimonas sp.]